MINGLRQSACKERPVAQVPRLIILLLLTGLAMQILWHSTRPYPQASATELGKAPSMDMLRIASLGDTVALSKALNLWLQIYDNQPGISIPFRELDYTEVRSWLNASLELDPRGHYPLLAAVRLYGEVPDPQKQEQALEFAYEKFLAAPNLRWPWLAHAVVIARHRLQNLELALKYANALADKATGPQVPHWAQQMSIFVLEDMGETEAARILIGGLLDSGQITDPHEFSFLSDRLTLITSPVEQTENLSKITELGNE